jgi:hypothetical protein
VFPDFATLAGLLLHDREVREHLNGHNHRRARIPEYAPDGLGGYTPMHPAVRERLTHRHREQQERRHNDARARKVLLLLCNDPLFERCMHVMGVCVARLPASLQDRVFDIIDEDPKGFMSLYEDVRVLAEGVERELHARKRATR